MPVTKTIDPPAWMSAKSTRKLISALESGGADIRFVGGCVRDAILGKQVKDIDLATPF